MIRIGSRGSDLALTQARWVGESIRKKKGLDYEIEIIQTKGDLDLESPLPAIGGKGVFTSELEKALREKRIDIAVHSLKDLPVENPDGLIIGAIPKREDPRDRLLFAPENHDPEGGSFPIRSACRLGSSSLRRRGAASNARSDLRMLDLRGNVPTRVEKLRRGEFDAIILAAAGLNRLGLDLGDLETVDLPVDRCPPAPAQGALGIQCRADDEATREILSSIHDATTAACVTAERRVLTNLGGGCSMPVGVLIQPTPEQGFRVDAGLFSSNERDGAILFTSQAADPDLLADEVTKELQPFVNSPLADCRLLLLRPGGEGGALASALQVAGAEVETRALTEIRPIPATRQVLSEITKIQVLAFSSAHAVDRFFEEANGHGIALDQKRIYAGGEATASALKARGISSVAPNGSAGGAALATTVLEAEAALDRPVLYPCARERHGQFEKILGEAGVSVLSETRLHVESDQMVLFTSPSAVRAFSEQGDAAELKAIAIGPTTAQAMKTASLPCLGTASTPTPNAVVALLKEIRDD
ncbi:MAG: hydroxymethylbilane synthase [Planctomycetota bacterium]|jgi:hydroxymethylbilane synthase